MGARPTSPPDPENLLEVAGARNPSDLSTGKEMNWWAAGRTIPWVGDTETGKKFSPYPPPHPHPHPQSDAAQGGPEAALVHDVIKDVGSPLPAACHTPGFERGAVMDKGAPQLAFIRRRMSGPRAHPAGLSFSLLLSPRL